MASGGGATELNVRHVSDVISFLVGCWMCADRKESCGASWLRRIGKKEKSAAG